MELGELDVEGETNLTDFTGLENLDSIGGDFLIEGNSSMISLNGLSHFDSRRRFVLHGNTNITSYDGLDQIERIEGIKSWLRWASYQPIRI